MKKLFLVLAAAFAMVACQTDINEVGVVADGVAAVEFEVGAPQMRSYSDGMTATKLQYAVYEVKAGQPLEYLENLTPEEIPTLVGGAANVKIELANNKKYAVIFWASASVDGPYTFDAEAMTVTVSYDGAACNDESRDAFYAYQEFEVKGAATLSVELRRPFAQLNVGTSDLTAAQNSGFNPKSSSLKVKNVYSTLNLVDGTASDNVLEVTFATADVPTGETFPVDGNAYMAMSYVLVGKDKASYDVVYTIKAEDNTVITNTIGAVPMQANYRTNIYGKLLTSSTDINVEINPDYNEPDYSVYNVMVDGVSYDNFAVAVEKAMESGKSVEFIQNVTIDADETITVPAGKVLTLNLNGHTLSGVTDDADKNDDGNITSADNEVMFDVRGTMNVNGGRVTIKHVGDSYANFGWNACGEAFYVAFNGVLNVNEATIENFGGVPMAYAIDLVNASATRCDEAGVHLNVESSVLKSSYIPVRVFNNGAGMNHVTINNSTLEGTSRAFWVHVYSSADNGGRGEKSATLNIDIYNNGNTFIANSPDRLIEYGFTDEINVRPDGTIALKDAEGNVVEGIGMDLAGNYAITTAQGFVALSALVAADGDNGFAGKTVKLAADIDLFQGYMSDGDPVSTEPIGSTGTYDNKGRLVCKPFKGTFDGQGHTIKNIYQNGYLWNYWFGQYGSIGLFSELENATVKNLVIENFDARVEGGDIAIITGSASGTCVFEDIEIKDSKIATFNNGCGGIIGWSGAGNYTFKNIKLDANTSIGGFQQSFDASVGGIVGQAEPGATYNFENIEINCCLNVFNDAIASYQYYLYRMCGMVVGRCQETTTINGSNYPDLSKYNMTFNNVVVNYGDWMNYHYQVDHGGGPKGNGSRVEAGFLYNGHSCENDGEALLLPFDQLIGGDQYGVRGLREVEGVTVNYPASYRREVASAAALTEALGKGVSVILDADIDYGTNQLAITGENQVVDLGGHALTTANNWGGISLKNGATIKNGTITHAGNTAAIKAFNGTTVENVTINATCTTADKTVTGIAVQQGANVESIKNVTINGVSQGIEVGYQATVGLIENAVVNESNNGSAKGIALVINGGKVGKAKDCTFKGETYGVTMHLKGVFAVGLELENCKVEGATASIYAWDEKGISNTSGSLNLTYDAATTLTGPFVWDFEDECQSVVTLNRPQ